MPFRPLPQDIAVTRLSTGKFARFDITRQKFFRDRETFVDSVVNDSEPWPTGDELPNDDMPTRTADGVENGQQDCEPRDSTSRLMSFDSPGYGAPPQEFLDVHVRVERRMNFNEFCRVRLDGVWPQENLDAINQVDGSRCSGKLKWHMVLDIVPERNAAGALTGYWRKTKPEDLLPRRMDNAVPIGIHLDATVIDVLKPSGN